MIIGIMVGWLIGFVIGIIILVVINKKNNNKIVGVRELYVSCHYEPKHSKKNNTVEQYTSKKIKIKSPCGTTQDKMTMVACTMDSNRSKDLEVSSVVIGGNFIEISTYDFLLDPTGDSVRLDSNFEITVNNKKHYCTLTKIHIYDKLNEVVTFDYYFNIINKK